MNIDDLLWDYLEGDGDFRSEEVKKLRDKADIIVTNPPFSLFRDFFNWIMEGEKQFLRAVMGTGTWVWVLVFMLFFLQYF